MEKHPLKLIPQHKLEAKLYPSLSLQIKLSELSLVDMEKYLYQLEEENPYLKVTIPRQPFFKKIEQEYQDDIQLKDTHIISYLDDLKEELLFMKLNSQEKLLAELILSSILPNGMLSVSLEAIAYYAKLPISLVQGLFFRMQQLAPIRELAGDPVRALLEKSFLQKEEFAIAWSYWLDLLQCSQKFSIQSEFLPCKKQIEDIFLQKYSHYQLVLVKMDRILEELLWMQGLFESTEDSSPSVVLKPDCIIEKVGQELKIRMGEEIIFTVLGEEESAPSKKAKELLKEAENIAQLYRRREGYLLSLTEILVQFQSSYFLEGAELEAISQKELALTLGVQESTVSRFLRDKYFRYQDKVQPLQFLVTKNIKQNQGKYISQQKVIQEIKDILHLTQGNKITDEKLKELLSYKGILLSRRTVNKYRNILLRKNKV